MHLPTRVLVQDFLKEEKIVKLSYPPYLPDLSPCDCFLLPLLKTLCGRQYDLVGWLFWVKWPFETIFQSISGGLPKRGRKRRVKTDESKNDQTIPTRTYCKRSRPLPYYHPKCRTPLHWKFTQDHRTTRPPLAHHLTTPRQYESQSAIGSAVYQCPLGISEKAYFSAFSEWISILEKCVSVKGDYPKVLKYWDT